MTDWQRLEKLIEWANMTTNSFAHHIGLKSSENLYRIKHDKNGISKKLIAQISEHYPQINQAWLATGQGDMFDTATQEGSYIPFYNYNVIDLLGMKQLPASNGNIYIPRPCDFTLAAIYQPKEFDMIPIKNGAIIFLSQVDPKVANNGSRYVVVTKKFVTLQQMLPCNDPTAICLSKGDGSKTMIARDKIIAMYAVKAEIDMT